MSIGRGGWAEVFVEDDTMIIYRYGSYDLNEPEYRNDKKVQDGSISIYKHNLPENLRKSFSELLKIGTIEVINCKNCWHIIEKYDFIALSLLLKIAREYDENDGFPNYVDWHT